MALFTYQDCTQAIKSVAKKGVKSISLKAEDQMLKVQNARRVKDVNERLEADRKKHCPNRPTLSFLGRDVHVNVVELMNERAFGLGIDVPDGGGRPYTMLTLQSGTHYHGKPMGPYMAYLNTRELPGPELLSFIEQNGLGKPVLHEGEPVWSDLGAEGRKHPIVLYQFDPKVIAKLDLDGYWHENRKQQSRAFDRTMREHVHYTKEQGVTFDAGYDPADWMDKGTSDDGPEF